MRQPIIDARYVIVGETRRARAIRVLGPPIQKSLGVAWKVISALVWTLIFAMFIARAGGFGKQFWHDTQCQNAGDQATAYCQSAP